MISVTIDPHSGFCVGVVRAIKKVEKFLSDNPETKLFCIGSIVHNSEEVRRLEKEGLVTITNKCIQETPVSTVLIRAHGEPPATYKDIKNANHKLIDATCKVVLNLQQKIRKTYCENPDKQIVIFGKHGHAEVIGLQGHTENKAVVINDISEIEGKIDMQKDILLFSQTTMSQSQFVNLELSLKKYCEKNVKRFNTICKQVVNRENQLKLFAKSKDIIIFISGRDSSNGQQLYKICFESNPNCYLISTPEEIRKEWFSDEISVGICGATSTPLWLMEKTAQLIMKITN